MAVGAGLSATSMAQLADSSKNLYVAKPGPYDPLGIRMGSFYAFPSIEVLGLYDDNVYADSADKRSDEILVVSPQIQVESNWSRHKLQLFAGGEFGFHNTFGAEDYKDYLLQAHFQGDLTRATKLELQAEQARDHQERGDPEAVEGLKPTIYDRTEARAQLNQSLGRLSLSAGGRFARYDFKDTPGVNGIINNHDRNRDIFVADAKAAFEFSPGYQVYTEFAYNWRDFDDAFDDVGINRDSEGYELTAGVQFELTDLLEGAIFGGYMTQNPDDPRLIKIDGAAFGASLIWHPTELTTVSLEASRAIQESFLLDATGYFADRVRLSVGYKLRENLDITVFGLLGQDDYQGISRNDSRYGGGVNVFWGLNRFLAAKVAYTYDRRNSDFPGIGDFARNRVAIALEARY
ncbi:outer membrane beta-barrel protein [Emcibacter sp. SYSU 3D8]|uniref:outer membrane beta-barrel protein n=1 Tax=Emcibacter sp. SYSU 3D8 TaxID=3133969 RepID=UPI0031FE5993